MNHGQLKIKPFLFGPIKILILCFKVIQNQEYLQLNVEQMTNLLRSDDLNIESEEQIFHAVMDWINYEPIDRRQHVGYLLGFVKLPLISTAFLVDQVEPAVGGKFRVFISIT